MIILKCIKQDGAVCTGFIWLRIWTRVLDAAVATYFLGGRVTKFSRIV
jgi:hypothetical protein